MKCLLSFFQAYDHYLNLKIDPKKLVMGLPWYGYDYPCLNLSQVRYCSVKILVFYMFLRDKTGIILPVWLWEWQYVLGGLPWNFKQTFMGLRRWILLDSMCSTTMLVVPRGSILIALVTLWSFFNCHQQVKVFTYFVQYVNIYWMDWHNICYTFMVPRLRILMTFWWPDFSSGGTMRLDICGFKWNTHACPPQNHLDSDPLTFHLAPSYGQKWYCLILWFIFKHLVDPISKYCLCSLYSKPPLLS